MNTNFHIEEYLDYYTQLNFEPGYAVLLRGEWGCGKTWFIKNYFSKKSEPLPYLYVSLNGVASHKEIEDAFFQQLHPFLASKGMKIAGKVLKGILKTAIKVDLNSDSKEEGSIPSQIPDIHIPDYLKDLDNRPLVFDDLERCLISVPNILGYINQFVEEKGLKVIILANENEIIGKTSQKETNNKTEEAYNAYLNIKEKVIGKSFEVQSDFESAISAFMKNLSTARFESIVGKNINTIQNLYKTAGYDNLRHLKQAILDFERFYKLLPDRVHEKNDLFEHITNLFFSISFELRRGVLKEDDIPKLFSSDYIVDKSNSEQTLAQKIRDKYPVFGFYHHPVNPALLTRFFKVGTVDKNYLSEVINNSVYFLEENKPKWIKLWYFTSLNDDDFKQIQGSVYEEFKCYRIADVHVLIQVTGMMLIFSELNLIQTDKAEILKIAKLNIERLKKKLQLRLLNGEVDYQSSYGLGYHGLEIGEFKEFFEYVKHIVYTSQVEDLPLKAADLLKDLDTSISAFGEKIVISNSANNLYYQTPILNLIPIEALIDAFFRLSNSDKKEFARYLEARYSRREFNHKLIDELEWLKKLHQELRKSLESLTGTISGFLIENYILKSVERSIDLLSVANSR